MQPDFSLVAAFQKLPKDSANAVALMVPTSKAAQEPPHRIAPPTALTSSTLCFFCIADVPHVRKVPGITMGVLVGPRPLGPAGALWGPCGGSPIGPWGPIFSLS